MLAASRPGILEQETMPLASRVISVTAALAADSAALMDDEVASVKFDSAVTVWLLVLLILTMLIVAYGVSRRYAEALTKPLAALSRAT